MCVCVAPKVSAVNSEGVVSLEMLRDAGSRDDAEI
jgi:hypothetical protein